MDLLQRIINAEINKNTFPRYETGFNLAKRDYESSPGLRLLDRIQVRIDETRFAFLMRHPTGWHWCGYILVPEDDWMRYSAAMLEHCIMPLTFAAHAYDPITWMEFNTNAQLKSPVEITKNDFWVGFGVPQPYEQEWALNALITCEQVIHGIRYGTFTPGG